MNESYNIYLILFYFRHLSTTEHKLQFTLWLIRFIFTSLVFILGIKAPGIRQRNQLIHQGLYWFQFSEQYFQDFLKSNLNFELQIMYPLNSNDK